MKNKNNTKTTHHKIMKKRERGTAARKSLPDLLAFLGLVQRFALSAAPEPNPKKREGRANFFGEGDVSKIPAVRGVNSFAREIFL